MVDKDRSGLTTADELALLVESVEDYALFFLEPNGGIRSWNRGAARIFGYSEEEVIGRIFSIFYSEDDIAAKKPARELETAASAGRVEDEGWRIRKNGERFWANTIITALHDARGALIGFAKITRDLTQRREAEERVRRSEELFRLLVESVQPAPDATRVLVTVRVQPHVQGVDHRRPRQPPERPHPRAAGSNRAP